MPPIVEFGYNSPQPNCSRLVTCLSFTCLSFLPLRLDVGPPSTSLHLFYFFSSSPPRHKTQTLTQAENGQTNPPPRHPGPNQHPNTGPEPVRQLRDLRPAPRIPTTPTRTPQRPTHRHLDAKIRRSIPQQPSAPSKLRRSLPPSAKLPPPKRRPPKLPALRHPAAFPRPPPGTRRVSRVSRPRRHGGGVYLWRLHACAGCACVLCELFGVYSLPVFFFEGCEAQVFQGMFLRLYTKVVRRVVG